MIWTPNPVAADPCEQSDASAGRSPARGGGRRDVRTSRDAEQPQRVAVEAAIARDPPGQHQFHDVR